MANATRVITVQPGDRIDTLAVRAYGDPTKYRALLEANPTLDIWNPQPGTIIEVPDA
jgi:nucleoid-associated protein YgaU